MRQDLIVVLKKLAKRVAAGTLKLDGIVIETTGMADPAPVAQTFFVDDDVKAFARLDGIITLVDAKHIEQHLDEEKPEGAENEAVEQVAFADRMLLNKTDLVSEADLTRVEARLKSINSFAQIKRCCQSQVHVDSVLDISPCPDPQTNPDASSHVSVDSVLNIRLPSLTLLSMHARGRCLSRAS